MPFVGNQPAQSYSSFAKQDFTTSATTSYTLDYPVANENEIALFINFVRQEPTTAYTASGTSLTLTSATSASDDMYAVFIGKAVQTITPLDGSITSAKISYPLTNFTSTGIDDNATSTAITIDSSERVGIGTGSPNATLNIQSSTDASIDIDATSGSTQDAFIKFTSPDNGTVYLGVDDSEQLFKINNVSALSSANHFVINTSGNVGIGNSIPSSFSSNANNLVVGSGSGEAGITIYSGSANKGNIYFADSTSAPGVYTGFIDYQHSTNSLRMGSNGGIERMRIDGTGHLLLNTTAFNGGATVGFQINATSTSSGAYAQLIKNNSGTEIFQMRCNGGLANYSSSNVNLSDEREKKNIEDMHSSWNDVKNWSLRKYHYKSDEDTDDKRYGVVAQEIEKITPELVTVFNKSPEILWQEGEELPEGVSVGDVKTEAIERKGVHEQQMFWTAIKSLQEAMQRIETLEAKNTELEARITALENA